jgi:hypothetical protein
MKSFLTILILYSSSIAFASKVPTMDEFDKYANQISGSSSVASIIKDIKTGKINLIAEFRRDNDGKNARIISIPGRSSFASQIIEHRFDARKPLGNEQENLLLLDTIIKSGVDLNIIQTDNLSFQNGANPSLEDFYWVKAFRQWFDADSGSQFEKNCFDVADQLSDKSNTLGMYAIEKLFFPFTSKDYGRLGSFSQGGPLDIDLSPKMKSNLESNLGIKLSTRPEGDAPTDEWTNEFFSMMSVVRGQDDHSRGQNWWNGLSDTEKKWACYASSFDEALTAYHNLGITDEELTTKTVGGSYVIFPFDKFPVYVFGPYCNSIK